MAPGRGARVSGPTRHSLFVHRPVVRGYGLAALSGKRINDPKTQPVGSESAMSAARRRSFECRPKLIFVVKSCEQAPGHGIVHKSTRGIGQVGPGAGTPRDVEVADPNQEFAAERHPFMAKDFDARPSHITGFGQVSRTMPLQKPRLGLR